MRNRVLAALLYVFAANVPLWIAGRLLGLTVRGWFGVEFLLIGILSVFLRPAVTAALLFAAIVFDVAHAISRTYVLDLDAMLRSSSSAVVYAPAHGWSIAMIAVSALVPCAGVLLWSRKVAARRQQAGAVLLAALLICGLVADLARGQVPMTHPDRKMGSFHLLRASSSWALVEEWQQWNVRRVALASGASPEVSPTAGASLVLTGGRGGWMAGDARPDIVLVLVESWGQLAPGAMSELLERPYRDPGVAGMYTVSQGTVPFHGPTLSGETRELCGTALGFGVMTVEASRLEGCLPAQLGRMGYHTTAVHGFSERMFQRAEWYRRAQFGEMWFREQLDAEGLPRCEGPFPGTCDAAVAGWMGDRLEASHGEPQFLYWVTLGSHLPVPVPNGVNDAAPCSSIGEVEGTPLCSWYQLVGNVHRSVARMAARVTRPTVFVVVGDHAPPFSDAETRRRFSSEVVPYVVLEPLKPGEDRTLDRRCCLRRIPRAAARANRRRGF